MKKKKIIISSLIIALLLAAAIGVTLYLTIWNNPSSGSQKTNLNTVITTTEINGNEANEEDSVFNKILELHNETGLTEQDIQIKENSFHPADNNNAGAAIITAQETSNYTGEVNITITPLSEKIDLGNESLQYLAQVIYMNEISDQEANIIKTDLQTNIANKMNDLNLGENIDYQVSDNLNEIKAGDNLNSYIHHIIISSLPTSDKATGSFIIEMNVQEDINNRSVEIQIEPREVDGLSAEAAQSITNNILIKVQTILTKGQINIKDVDYQIINLDAIKEGAKFDEYNNQITVKGISEHLTGEFLISFVIEQ